ncbi:TonB-dependent receptor [Roseateles koreensis]|uniref:TonB-dependent receptor n=1 Tax=Roseateles koreensis TaxID=2987526 RepID=A0ABT5KXL6_9BURK|nr:TonB-dependent receptor [Roseateles koreensis]MDC8787165.1 TonB-dependent receptor [Roseateles koreensis]
MSTPFQFRQWARLASPCCLLAVPTLSLAQQAEAPFAPVMLERTVISATRSAVQPFNTPAAISRVDGDELRDSHAQINISEGLSGVPGLLARDRQNYAQDVQLSVRGFGARASFGIRGVRLYVDGIPATLPDGQGQISHVELGSVERIEVLRGPFSALYGNASGGVIQVFTEDGSAPPRLSFNVAAGSDGLHRLSAQARGATDAGLNYTLGASRFQTEGYRQHSDTDRRLANAKLSWQLDPQSRLTLVLNALDLPQAQDPMGLSRAQLAGDPRGVDSSALSFNTRKTLKQTQMGASIDRQLDANNTVQLTVYGGSRSTEQFQSIPVAAQKSPLHPGGAIDLHRDYEGADLRWSGKANSGLGPINWTGGLAYDLLKEHRQGYQNFIGSSLGVQGALRRDENNTVSSTDPYVQANWQLAPQISLNAGVRHSQLNFKSQDHYVTASNPDDSGSAHFSATLPVLGLLWAVSPTLHAYATAGRGFETPTLNELSYRPSGASGLNFALQAAHSDSIELGVKLSNSPQWGELAASVFQTGTDQEIVTQTNLGGRATYQNAGRTRRLGFELAWAKALLPNLRTQLAYTALDAEYRDGYMTCTATPCATANQSVAAGNKMPGIAKHALFAALNWAPPQGWRAGVEARALSRIYVNDLNTDAAAGYTTLAANAGYVLALGAWDLNAMVRVDNLLDQRYVGSVIVNEGNARYFEPAPGRTWLASATASLKF